MKTFQTEILLFYDKQWIPNAIRITWINLQVKFSKSELVESSAPAAFYHRVIKSKIVLELVL